MDSDQDWVPADVVQTTSVMEGTSVLAEQGLSDALVRALPKGVPWQRGISGGPTRRPARKGQNGYCTMVSGDGVKEIR